MGVLLVVLCRVNKQEKVFYSSSPARGRLKLLLTKAEIASSFLLREAILYPTLLALFDLSWLCKLKGRVCVSGPQNIFKTLMC